MRVAAPIAACLILACSIARSFGFSATVPVPPTALKIITVDDARKHLSMLAADSMQGRNTPSPQLEIAAQYVADRFKEYGLQPVNGSYFQRYAVSRINLGTDNAFTIMHDNPSTRYEVDKQTGQITHTPNDALKFPMEIKTDWVPYDFTAATTDTADVVFAGYGITAPEYKYDDYDGLDVKGKFVFVLRHEPDEKNTDSTFFRGKRFTRYAEVRQKMKNAREHGAIGIVVVNDPANHILLKPEGYPWPSLFFKNMREDDLPISLADAPHENILAVHAGEHAITALFGTVDSLIAVQKSIDSTHRPHSFPLAGFRIAMKVDMQKTEITVPNVVGWWQGDRNDSEHIVIGAHMDHVGTTRAGEPGQDTIYNGADDNASGTTGVLEIARAFTAAPNRPHRSVLFMTFSGEEKGLFGSRAYAAHPLVSLSQCVAMINMDMIGRNDPDSLELGGAGRSPELTEIAVEQNKEIGFKLKETDDFLDRSDQASFSAKKIPVLFFFTGEHADYHKVTDSIDKINFEKLTRVATLGFRTAWELASMSTRFVYKDTPGK